MRTRRFLLFALLAAVGMGEAFAQAIDFSKETFTASGITLPYRKADIPGLSDKASLVIYLHGGTSKGDDNEAQLQEPGIQNIAKWLADNNRKAIMVVPQCPKDKSWLGPMQPVVKDLLQGFIDSGVADADKVYIFGGSMGGTGTWNMIAAYPTFFAAAMPVAGNPSGLDASALSQTPLFTVMGTADAIMKLANVTPVLEEMDTYNATYKIEVENGWTHEDVCKNSYTEQRLNWVFSHTGNASGIAEPAASTQPQVTTTIWYSLSGKKLNTQPKENGIYIRKTLFEGGLSKAETIQIKQ